MRPENAHAKSQPILTAVLLLAAASCSADQDESDVAAPSPTTVRSADGLPIAFSDYGQGSLSLVLVHGWSCDRGYWAEQVGPLSDDYRVITVDLGGHGKSGLGRDDWTIASFGNDVAAVVDYLELDSVILVGHSMGGDVIFQAARQMPNKVRALIMVDTYRQIGDESSDAEIDEFVAGFSADFPSVTEQFVRAFFPENADPSLVDTVARDMASAPPEVALSAIRSSFRHAREMPTLIQDLDLPVIAINADEPPTDIESMSRYGIDVMTMNGVGHFLMMEEPEKFNEVLLTIIRDLK